MGNDCCKYKNNCKTYNTYISCVSKFNSLNVSNSKYKYITLSNIRKTLIKNLLSPLSYIDCVDYKDINIKDINDIKDVKDVKDNKEYDYIEKDVTEDSPISSPIILKAGSAYNSPLNGLNILNNPIENYIKNDCNNEDEFIII